MRKLLGIFLLLSLFLLLSPAAQAETDIPAPPGISHLDEDSIDALKAYAAWCVVHAGQYPDAASYWTKFMEDPEVLPIYKESLLRHRRNMMEQIETIRQEASDTRAMLEDLSKNTERHLEEMRENLGGEMEGILERTLKSLKSLYGKPDPE